MKSIPNKDVSNLRTLREKRGKTEFFSDPSFSAFGLNMEIYGV